MYIQNLQQRKQLDLVQKLNQRHLERRQQDAQLEARLQSYELASYFIHSFSFVEEIGLAPVLPFIRNR